MRQYQKIVNKILENGWRKENRTGVSALTIPGAMFEHDMSEGFPLLTTKKMAWKGVRVELEGFIKGITDKRWYQERGCHIWDEWCNPEKVPYGHDHETKARMKAEPDLGPIYGWQWRHTNAEYHDQNTDYTGKGIDQLANTVNKLKSDPHDRRMIISAWNPKDIPKMALPPCHYSFQTTVTDGKVNLMWNQRSVDTMLGLPFNIASYGLMLHLLAKESKLEEGKLIGFLGDTHIYENHIKGAREQLSRDPMQLPRIETNFDSIFSWSHDQTKVLAYNSHPKITFPIAV